jgi:hypothetical protein
MSSRFATHPPNPSYPTVARTEGYTYAAKVWALCLVQGPFSVAPCQTLIARLCSGIAARLNVSRLGGI